MESLIPEGIRQLATQGTGWVLFCFAMGALFWTFRKLLVLMDARGEEKSSMVLALREGAEANADLARSIRDRTGAFEALSVLVTQLSRDYASNNERWRERVGGMEKTLDEIQREQREVKRLLDMREGRQH